MLKEIVGEKAIIHAYLAGMDVLAVTPIGVESVSDALRVAMSDEDGGRRFLIDVPERPSLDAIRDILKERPKAEETRAEPDAVPEEECAEAPEPVGGTADFPPPRRK